MPPLWDVVCLVAGPEKHTKPRMENIFVNICLICLSLPVVRMLAMTFLFVNLNLIDIICIDDDADP